MSSPLDKDLKFGQIAVRMGMLPAQNLPKLVQEARKIRERSGEDTKRNGLGQLLVRKKLLTVSEYLVVARECERSFSGEGSAASLRSLEAALKDFETGEIDGKSLEAALSSEDVKIEMPSREEMPPTFGRYELIEEIARGGMGIVYRAKDQSNDQVLALKVMIEADDDEARLARFEREAELAKALDHPGIVKVYDAGTIDSMPYFTMDLVEGKSLDDLIEKGLDKLTAIGVLAQTARAVDHAHKRGIVHRDLKPGNILIDGVTGAARVTDFGLARDMDRNTRITRVGQAVGTPYYMAPEQVRGERDVDGRADTYAIGVMLYEILTGEVPFDADSALTLFKKIDREPVNLPLDPEKGIDEKIHAITMRALQKKRDDRYATSKLLAEDLERYLKGVSPKARAHTSIDDLTTWVSMHRRGVAVGSIVVCAVLAISIGAVAILARVAADGAQAAGSKDVRACLERATSLVETGEGSLAQRPADARDAARRALDDLDRARDLGTLDGPRGQGAQDAYGRAGPAVRKKALWLLARSLDGPDARAALEEAAKLPQPEAPILHRLGQLRQVQGDLEGAIAAFGAALELNPKDAAARIARGEALLDSDKADKAIIELSEALRVLPASSAPTSDRVRALLLRSRAYIAQALVGAAAVRQNALTAARDDADLARNQPGTLPEPYLAVAAVHRARAALETTLERKSAAIANALEACSQAQAIAPNSPEVALMRADIYLAHGQRALAAASYDEAFRLAAPERGWSELLGRGIARAHRFALDDARGDLEEASRRAARSPLGAGETVRHRSAVRARIATELSNVLLAMGDAGAARLVLEASIRNGSTSPLPLTALANIELAAGERDAALAHLEQARPLLGSDTREAALVNEALARTRLARGELVAALQFANVAAALCGQRPEPRVRRATALCRAASAAQEESAQAAAIEHARIAWAESFAAELDGFEQGRPSLDLATSLLVDGAERAALARSAQSLVGRPLPRLMAEAQLRLEAALRVDPLRAPALVALAELHLAAGHPDLALDAARRSFAIDATSGRADEVAVEALLASNDPTAASEAAARALALGETTVRLLLGARAAVARGDSRRALDLIEKARAKPLDDDQEVEVDALTAAALEGPAALARVRAERADARAKLLARALAAEAGDAASARADAERLAKGRGARLLETRGAVLLLARLSKGQPFERLTACAKALGSPDASALEAAHRALSPTWRVDWRADKPGAARQPDLVKRFDEGDPEAAVAVALAHLEETFARKPTATAAIADLPVLERAVRLAPTSLVPRIAHALEALAAEDLISADDDVALLRDVAPEAPLVLLVAAQLALARGDRDLARDLELRAKANSGRAP